MTLDPSAEDLTVKTGGKLIGGWTGVRVTRGVDQLPSIFSIETTERMPGDATIAAIKAGDVCQVYLGRDLILTGYLDVDAPHIDKEAHVIAWAGRSKTQDLVDCSIMPGQPDSKGNVAFRSWQIRAATVKDAVAPICAPFGISLVLPDGNPTLPAGYTFIIQPGMTCFQMIEQIAAATQMLIWDDPNGNLVLSLAGAQSRRAATALIEGQNIEIGDARLSSDQRFSDVYVLAQTAVQASPDGLLHWNSLGHAVDPGVLRYRPRVVIIDQPGPDPNWPQKYADWEVHRRYGRSQQRLVLVTGWRDGAGALWAPNTLVNLSSPTLKSPAPGASGDNGDRVIAAASWRRTAAGTQTLLTTMPKEGLSVAPFHFVPPVPGAVTGGPASTASTSQPVGP